MGDDGDLIALTGCGAAGPEPSGAGGGPIEGTWALTRYASGGALRTLPGTLRTEITFAAGRVGGRAAINTYRGPFTADGAEGGLSIGPLASTRVGGAAKALAAEADYLAALESAASYSSDAQVLTIYDAAGARVLAFEKSDRSIVGAWEVTGFNNGEEAVVSLVAGSAITAAFGRDLTLTGDSGVNRYRTTYSTTEDASGETGISIAPPAGTRSAGPAALTEQERLFLAALESAASFTIQADQLTLRDATDAIAVTLTRS